MAEYKITDMRQTTKVNKNMEVQEVYEIAFTVGDHGPFVIHIPVENYTSTVGQVAVREKAQEISGTLGI